MTEKKLLITGFQPFGGQEINPSWEAVRALPDTLGSWELHKLLLPVEYGRAAEEAREAALALGAQAVLCVGQAGGRDAVTPEVIGINLRDSRLPDNAGTLLQGVPVDPAGPDGLFATAPVRQMVRAIQERGIAARLSYSAGAYVCNDLLYSLLLAFRGTGTRVGFIHVPWLPRQGQPSLLLEDITAALRAAVEAL